MMRLTQCILCKNPYAYRFEQVFAPASPNLEWLLSADDLGRVPATTPSAKNLHRGYTAPIATFLVCQLHRNFPEQTQLSIVDPLSGSDESADRSAGPDGAIREQVDHQQHDPDQEQDPGNLDRHRCYPCHIQSPGNQSNHQEY